MPRSPGSIGRLRADAERHGLSLRGAFVPEAQDGVPDIAEAVPARALVLFGHAGAALWDAFGASPELRDGAADPLDRWTRRVAGEIAARFGAKALFPFGGPPHHPFLRWARRAENLSPSPVGMLVHPEYGLWHAYRFALGFATPLEALPAPPPAASPCAGCSARPCLTTCPAGAFTGTQYRVDRCLRYLEANPGAACWSGGCRPRHACPVGQAYRYPAVEAQFHMRAFFLRQTGRELPEKG